MEYVIYKKNDSESLETAVRNKTVSLYMVPNDFDEDDILNFESLMTNCEINYSFNSLLFTSKEIITNAAKFTKFAIHCLFKFDGKVSEIGAYEFDIDNNYHKFCPIIPEEHIHNIGEVYPNYLNQVSSSTPVVFELCEDSDLISIETTNPNYNEYNIKVTEDLLYASMSDIAYNINNEFLKPQAVVFTLA